MNPERQKIDRIVNSDDLFKTNQEIIFTSDYDYPSITRMLDLCDYDGNTSLEPIVIGNDLNGDLIFAWGSIFGFSNCIVGPSSARAKILQTANAGPLAGKALIGYWESGSTNIYTIALDSINSSPNPCNSLEYLAGPFSGLLLYEYSSTGEIWGINDKLILYSSDLNNFELIGTVGQGAPSNLTFDDLYQIHLSPDGQTAAIFGCMTGEGQVINGINPDSANGCFVQWTTDGGASWMWERIGSDGMFGTVTNRPGYAPLFWNFAQTAFRIDNNGYIHCVVNGYGYWDTGTDTTFSFPILYNKKNTADGTVMGWLAVSEESVEHLPLNIAYPGNGIGQSYPTLSTTEDGEFVFCAWQGPEHDGMGNVNIYPGDGGGNTGPAFYTDILYAYSTDGGGTWTIPDFLIGDPDVQECYPYLAEEIEIDQPRVHYAYLIDNIPGTSIFTGGNDGSDNPWVYDFLLLGVQPSVGERKMYRDYKLFQNYPNPFNPVTVIEYLLPQKSKVKIKVYDILGKEISVLVDKEQTAGKHQATFSGEGLSSGIYFYQIQTTNVNRKIADFTECKKTIILK